MSAQPNIVFWKNGERAIPREFIKCGLFAVRGNRKREGCIKPSTIFSDSNKQGVTTVNYHGFGLNQDDLDVYLELLHLSKKVNTGEVISFTRSELLHSLGWPLQTRYRKKIIDCLDHLRNTAVSGNVIRYIGNNETTNRQFSFNLISEYSIYITDEDGKGTRRVSRDWSIVLPHGLNELFGGGGFARIDSYERKALSGNSLAKFIHAFIASNKYDGRFTPNAKQLHELSGSTRKKVKDFKAQELQKAIDCINDANISYEVCMNKVTGRLAMMLRSENY